MKTRPKWKLCAACGHPFRGKTSKAIYCWAHNAIRDRRTWYQMRWRALFRLVTNTLNCHTHRQEYYRRTSVIGRLFEIPEPQCYGQLPRCLAGPPKAVLARWSWRYRPYVHV